MVIKLMPATAPAHLKLGIFGDTGTGKTYTGAKMMAQFAAKYEPDKNVAMFDTEPSSGYVAGMIKEITGKELLVIQSRSFADLLDFCALCKEEGHVAIIDSITHPWRSLMKDFMDAKRSRVKGAGGNSKNVRLSLKDWGPIKDMWAKFPEAYCYDPTHICMCGREGDRWDTVEDEEGNSEMQKVGVKMKTETETGFEPSLLINMKLKGNKHLAHVYKDRFDSMPAGTVSANNPDIEFIMPHISRLDLGGVGVNRTETEEKVFENGKGKNWETIKDDRKIVLEEIMNDLKLGFPGMTESAKNTRIEAMRFSFETSSWTELEKKENLFPVEMLKIGREKLKRYIKEGDTNG